MVKRASVIRSMSRATKHDKRSGEQAMRDLHGGWSVMTQAVLRRRQASQGRFFRLLRSRAWPKLLCMVNLRRRAMEAEAASAGEGSPGSATSAGGLCMLRCSLLPKQECRTGTDATPDNAGGQWGRRRNRPTRLGEGFQGRGAVEAAGVKEAKMQRRGEKSWPKTEEWRLEGGKTRRPAG